MTSQAASLGARRNRFSCLPRTMGARACTAKPCSRVGMSRSMIGGRIRMYYGAADTCMAAADFEVREIVGALSTC